MTKLHLVICIRHCCLALAHFAFKKNSTFLVLIVTYQFISSSCWLENRKTIMISVLNPYSGMCLYCKESNPDFNYVHIYTCLFCLFHFNLSVHRWVHILLLLFCWFFFNEESNNSLLSHWSIYTIGILRRWCPGLALLQKRKNWEK